MILNMRNNGTCNIYVLISTLKYICRTTCVFDTVANTIRETQYRYTQTKPTVFSPVYYTSIHHPTHNSTRKRNDTKRLTRHIGDEHEDGPSPRPDRREEAVEVLVVHGDATPLSGS